MSGPIPFVAPHTVRISENVVTLATGSGGQEIQQALSVKALGQLRDRINVALDRYGRGEQDIIEG